MHMIFCFKYIEITTSISTALQPEAEIKKDDCDRLVELVMQMWATLTLMGSHIIQGWNDNVF